MATGNRLGEDGRQRIVSSGGKVDRPASAAEVRAANLAKTRFLANVSHELRTPLNAIMGFMELLAESDLDARQRHYVDLSKDAASTLLQLIEDLLDAGRMEAGYLELKSGKFRIHSLVQTVLSLHRPLAEQKGLCLRFHIDSRLPAWWLGDEGRIRQIFSNLVHNALKFTETGGVDVKIALAENGNLRFEVRDTGIGLKAENCAWIFDPFTQVEEGSTRHYGGTGLGLSICKQLVNLMGGEIGVISQPGQGSTFWTVLPLKPVDPPAEAEGSVESQATLGSLHGKVLVVEDNPLNQALLSEMLKRIGCRVEVVSSGEEALDRWERSRFDLVLMDCQLPGMDGYQITARLKQQDARRGKDTPPIVALTADVSEGVRERCLQSGMSACLHKPATIQDLFVCLKSFLVEGREQVTGPCVVEKRQSPAMFNAAAWRQLEQLTENQDRQLLRQVLSLFRRQGRQWMRILTQAFEDGDERAIVRTAHRFRSSCVHLGAEALAQGLLVLENAPGKADARLLAVLRAGFRQACCLLGAEVMATDRLS